MRSFPFGGLRIIDDIWAVAQERCDGRPDGRAEEGMKNVDVSLADLGVEVRAISVIRFKYFRVGTQEVS